MSAKLFAISPLRRKLRRMTQPLALVYYKNLLPGSQLVNRLEDLGYRVQTLNLTSELPAAAASEHPLVVVVDLTVHAADVCAAVAEMRAHEATNHVPVLAFSSVQDDALVAQAQTAGVRLVASHTAVFAQLPQLLEQVLEVE